MGVGVISRGVAAVLALGSLLLPGAAQAAFPGHNGKIAFTKPQDNGTYRVHTMNPDGTGIAPLPIGDLPRSSYPDWAPDGSRIAFTSATSPGPGVTADIYVQNADGSGQMRLTDHPGDDAYPNWSPNGTKVVFAARRDGDSDFDIYVMNADGTGQTRLTDDNRAEWFPEWSPDGKKIAFNKEVVEGIQLRTGIFVMDPDGTNVTEVGSQVPLESNSHPDWSPDGSKIAFVSNRDDSNIEIYVMNADGSAETRLTTDPLPDLLPAWSPDGGEIVFVRWDPNAQTEDLFVMNADGTSQAALSTQQEYELPDWQPIPVNAYPRPKGASPTDVSLVPAYEPCAAPNRTHGPPLAFPSCNPPQQEPGQLTVGTPDANGRPAKLRANIRINPLRGLPSTPADEADVRLRATINDVRLRSDLSDYTGELDVRLTLQITDKDNTPHPGGPGPATVQEFTHSHPLPCSATPADTTVGSTCQFDTTVEALVPGAVKELTRGIWELKRITVHDGAGNLFLTQGIFVP